MPEIHNIELKARLGNHETAVKIIEGTGAVLTGELIQNDYYFNCNNGRLKLRIPDSPPDELIFYNRENKKGSRASKGLRIDVDGASLLPILDQALGISVVVRKKRILFLYRNLRIHIDEVADLGCFVEMEAVISPGDDERESLLLVEKFSKILGIEDDDLIEYSYSDLLLSGR